MTEGEGFMLTMILIVLLIIAIQLWRIIDLMKENHATVSYHRYQDRDERLKLTEKSTEQKKVSP